jgi:hypothetical protein
LIVKLTRERPLLLFYLFIGGNDSLQLSVTSFSDPYGFVHRAKFVREWPVISEYW